MNHVPTGDAQCVEYCLINRALDGMSLGLVTVDTGGRIQWANRVALRLLGVRLGAAAGQPLGSMLRDPQLSAFWREAAEAEQGRMGEVSIRLPRPAHLRVHVTPCYDRSGEQIGRAMVFCDPDAAGTIELGFSDADSTDAVGTGGADPGLTLATNLTPQEVRVLRLVGQGLSNEDIARRMFVAPSTVRSHLKHVYRKTGLKSRAEAVRYANQNGLE